MAARVAVVGCGWWSTFAHLPALTRNPDAEVVALADPNLANRAAAAAEFGVPRQFDDIEELLVEVEVDAVVVAVPHNQHYRCAKIALEHGVHVLLEKPMVIDVGEARELVTLSRRKQLELIVGYPWNYNAQTLQLREAIAAGRLGKLEHVACTFASVARDLYRGNTESLREALGYTLNAPGSSTYSDPAIAGGGQSQTQLTHAVALLQLLTGLEAETVAGFTEMFELRVDLADAAAVRYPSGALGSVNSVGSVLPGHDELLEYRIFGQEGHLQFDVLRGTASIHTTAREDLPHLELDLVYPHWAPSDNLVELAQGRGANGSPPEIGFAAVAFVDALRRSAAAGGIPVAVERI
jgi:predicted dehydrogenase